MKNFGNFYRLITNKIDSRHGQSGALPVDVTQLSELNSEGYCIFWTPNGFEFGKRKKEDLLWINCFYADLDAGSLDEMRKKIRNYPEPSVIISTGKGFHCYWWLQDPIWCGDDPVGKADWFREWVMNRIVPALSSDPQAADACRLLRAPFFRYWKDGVGDKHTDIVWETNKFYSLEYLEKYFPLVAPSPIAKVFAGTQLPKGTFWEKANSHPVVPSLLKLSGTSHVNGEVYKIRTLRDGTARIDCNNKTANAWIDKNGKIGSVEGAGPSIPNWLWYYHRDWKKVAGILKEIFPELGEEK